tara:strand:- start:33 stop:425 length:393 start_codon:yes stop_codon:yes gene_type:complete
LSFSDPDRAEIIGVEFTLVDSIVVVAEGGEGSRGRFFVVVVGSPNFVPETVELILALISLFLVLSNKEPTEGVSFALWSRGLDFFFLDLNVVLGRVGGPVVVCSEAGRASSKISFFMKLFRTASVAIWDH